MKKLLLSISLLLCTGLAQAATITLNDTLCLGTVCSNPAPAVAYVSVSEQYGMVTASIAGVPLSTGTYQLDILGAVNAGEADPVSGKDFTLQGVRLLDPNGQLKYTATLTLRHWTTRTTSGKVVGQLVQHWELKSGNIT
jgi:hypothetical protein